MNILDNFSQKTLLKNQENVDKGKEEFDVLSVTTVNNKFNITIQNTGNLPINFTRMWVQNKTATDWISKYDISNAVSPGYVLKNIGQNVKLTALPTKEYSLKLVTGRGNVKELYVNSASLHPLDLKLYLLPTTVANKFTTTVLFTATNNMTNNAVLTNLQPNLGITPEGATAVLQSGPNPASYPVLERGEIAIFMWTYEISGNPTDKIIFTASLVNGYPTQSVSAEVTVNSILLSDQSQTSVTSAGLTSSSTPDDQLIFHKETTDALDGYQLQSVAADSSTGQIIQLDSTNPIFYTLNDTSSTITLPSGTWNAYLRYLSNSLPSSLTNNAASMIFHFEDSSSNSCQSNCKAKDSTTNNDLNLPTGTNKPTWILGGGVNGTSAFSFDGATKYLYNTINGNNDVQNNLATTAGWFKTSSSANQVIYRVGNQGDTKEFYEISLNNGKVLFRYSSKNNVIDGLCQTTTNGQYNNNKWQHFVAVKTGQSTCKLYINGTNVATDTDGTGGDDKIDVSGNLNIGRDPTSGTTRYFNGYIDDIIHWNNYALTQTQITDLVNTNYGTLAHKITFAVDRVDKNGNLVQNVLTNSSYPLPFKDTFGVSWTSPPDSSWGFANYTTKAPVITLNSNERLKFKMTFVHPSKGELSMKLKIDGTGVTSDKGNSFLQTTKPSSPFSAYYIYDSSQTGTVNILNSGPHNAFISYLSRVTFTSLDSTTSYGGFLTKIGSGSNIQSKLDGPILKVGQSQAATFTKPADQPGDLGQGQNIVPGKYRMYIFLSGYDDTGTIFLKTIYVVVRVI